MSVEDRPLRIALLAYRGNPHSGGQGVYIRHLATALARLGHTVEALSGPPYPQIDPPATLTPLPSLDLYRPESPFRPHRLPRSSIDLLELGHMCTAAFPEPLAFSLRASRWFRHNLDRFDVVHDNQTLGYGILQIAKRVPVVATVHHPVTVDRRLDIEHAPTLRRKVALHRWYSFTRMQTRVARQLPRLLTVSRTARDDIIRELGVDPGRIEVVPVGVDPDLFRPRPEIARVPGRLLAIASSDVPLKGITVLIEALAKVRTERPAHLVVVGRTRPNDPARMAAKRFGVEGAVEFTGSIGDDRLRRLYAEAEVAVVPSLYEGFSLPAIQAMASGIPLVATRVGAIPELAGPDGETGLLVPPGDPGALASAITKALDDPGLRQRLGATGRERALSRFTWERTAKATVDRYRGVLHRPARPDPVEC